MKTPLQRILSCMAAQGYAIATVPGEVNIVYVEGICVYSGRFGSSSILVKVTQSGIKFVFEAV